jgi:hypothetical protein
MRIIRLAIVGAAIAAGIGYIIKKNEKGESVLDGLTEYAPDLLEKIKELVLRSFNKFVTDIKE